MNTWQATAILTAARLGTPPEISVPLLPSLEKDTKKALRSIGMSHELIEREYPMEIIANALLLILLDPEDFERQLKTSITSFVSRN